MINNWIIPPDFEERSKKIFTSEFKQGDAARLLDVLGFKYVVGQMVDVLHGSGAKSMIIEQITSIGGKVQYKMEGETNLIDECNILGKTNFGL